jgi:hypothetical protein
MLSARAAIAHVREAIPEADEVFAASIDAGHDIGVGITFRAASIGTKRDQRRAVRVKGDIEGAAAALRSWAGERGYL